MAHEGDRRSHAVVPVMERLAQSAAMATISRLAMIVVAALFVPFCGVGGWVAVRIITTMDRLSEQQVNLHDELVALRTEYRGKMQLLDLTDLHLDAKLVETDGRLNKRIDAVSEWNRTNAKDIDNLKEKVYPLLRK